MAINIQTILYAITVLYWVAVIIALIAEDRDPSTTLAWILILCALPYVGLILYYFLGRDWAGITAKSKWLRARESIRVPFMNKIWEINEIEVNAFYAKEGLNVSQEVAHAIWAQTKVSPLMARDIEVWTKGEKYFPQLIDDLRAAQQTINMQYFIWEEDELTDSIVSVLMERLAAGVEVRILNDFFGSIRYSKKGMKKLKAAGAQVLSDVTAIKKANYRNHRKITIIDGVLAHTGGFNVGQEYIDGGKRYNSWRDTGIRLRGPAVFALQDLFCQRWFEVDGTSLYLEKFFPTKEIGSGDVLTQVAAHGVEDYWRSSARAYEVAISSADQYVMLQSPYYVPTEGLEEALINAALSGVDVHLMITGVPDKKTPWFAAFSYFERLLHAGVHVHLYDAGFMHAKSITVDDECCALGTMNLDVRSLELHKELMVWMYDKELAKMNKKIFEDDMTKCHEITLDEFESISFLHRFRNSAARLASKLL